MEEKNMEEINMEQTAEEGNGKKKKKRGSCGMIFLIAVVCFMAFVVINCIRNYGVRTDFDSIDEFEEYGGVVYGEIPESASNIKYYCNKISIFGLESAYSFVINDIDEFNAFMEINGYEIQSEDTVEEFTVNPPKYTDEFEIRDWHEYVAEESINDYIVLNYYSFDASYNAVLVNKETRKFVVIYYATL